VVLDEALLVQLYRNTSPADLLNHDVVSLSTLSLILLPATASSSNVTVSERVLTASIHEALSSTDSWLPCPNKANGVKASSAPASSFEAAIKMSLKLDVKRLLPTSRMLASLREVVMARIGSAASKLSSLE